MEWWRAAKVGMKGCACALSITGALALMVAPSHAVPASKAGDAAQTSPVVMSGSAGEWGYRCVFPPANPAQGPQFCLMQQSLMMEGQGGKAEPLGAVILARATENTTSDPLSRRPWRVTAMVPLALSLQAQPRIAVDGNSPITLGWQSCVATGCMASVDLTAEQAATFKGGKSGHIMVEKVAGGTLTINFAMDGAAAALGQLEGWIHQSPFRH